MSVYLRPKSKTTEQMRALLLGWSKAWHRLDEVPIDNLEKRQKAEEAFERTRKRLKEVLHWYLHDRVLISLPGDFKPWGQRPDDERPGDCSSGCLWFVSAGNNDLLSDDWGICCNMASERCGRLTWEHQGCRQADYGEGR